MLIYKLLESATKLIINKLIRNKYIYNYSSLLLLKAISVLQSHLCLPLPSKTAEGKFFTSLHKNDFSPR